MKIRRDFVSNSSSSSFIVACKNKSNAENAIAIATALKDDEKPVVEFFSNYTCLTLFEIGVDGHVYNSVPDGICIADSDLSKYFDSDGNVRQDLDFMTVFKELNWYTFDSNDNTIGENEQIVYEAASIMGKVNKYSVAFTEWLAKNANAAFGEKNIEFTSMYGNSCNNIEKVKAALEKSYNLYYIRYSYLGDAQCYGHIYVDFYDDDTPVFTRLTNANAIENLKFY